MAEENHAEREKTRIRSAVTEELGCLPTMPSTMGE